MTTGSEQVATGIARSGTQSPYRASALPATEDYSGPPAGDHAFQHFPWAASPRTYVWLGGIYVVFAAATMVFFLQSDVLYNSFVANQMAWGHIDVYRYFSSTPALKLVDTVMPPLYYLAVGGYLKFLLLLNIDPVTTNPVLMYSTVFGQAGGPTLSMGILLLKLPNFVALVVGLILMLKLARNAGVDSRMVGVLWLCSPALVVTSLMQAQNDGIPAAITAGALLAFSRKSTFWMMVLLGLAACFKTYAILLVPVTALLLSERNLITAIRLALPAFILPAVTILPFLSQDFMTRVFSAHDGRTLFEISHLGRMPTHFWALGYLSILVMAWVLSDRDIDLFDIASLWVVTLGLIFIVNWWLPQWTLWLLPMVVILAARDRVLAWIWVGLNGAILANDLFNFPGNMDGGMLLPIFGRGPSGVVPHVYLWHLLLLDQFIPFTVLDGVYMLCGVGFIALTIRCIQWLVARKAVVDAPGRYLAALTPARSAIAGPLLLVPYVAVMVVQRVLA